MPPSVSRARKRFSLSVHNGTSAHILTISGQHVAILAAMLYFVLRWFAVPAVICNPAGLVLIWTYILIAGPTLSGALTLQRLGDSCGLGASTTSCGAV